MDFDQSLFNIVVGFGGLCGGWILKTLWEVIISVQKSQKETDKEVADLKVMVAGQYVTRSDFNAVMSGVNTKLDYIVDTLNRKQDRKEDQKEGKV